MRGVAVLTITGVLSQLVGFVYRIGLTRLAGAEILGLYQLILPVYSVLLSLTSVGLTTAVSNLSALVPGPGEPAGHLQVPGPGGEAVFPAGPDALFPAAALFGRGLGVSFGGRKNPAGAHPPGPLSAADGDGKSPETLFLRHGRVYPAAITELAEQVLRSLLVLALLWRLAPDTAEKAVGTIVLGMALSEVVSALTQTVLFRVYLGPPAGLSRGETDPQGPPGQDWADRPAPGVCRPCWGISSPRPTRCSSPGCWSRGEWTRGRRCRPTA